MNPLLPPLNKPSQSGEITVTEIDSFVVGNGTVNITNELNAGVNFQETEHPESIVGKQYRLDVADADPVIRFDTMRPEVARINAVGETQYVGVGLGVFRIVTQNPGGFRRGYIVTTPISETTGPTITRVWQSFAAGSLAQHSHAQMVARLTGQPSDLRPLYSIRDLVTPAFTRNPNCWLNGLTGLTGITPGSPGAVAVSPRHCYTATHHRPGVGSAMRFVTADNQIVTRTIVDHAAVGSDISVLLLSDDLPGTIEPLKVLSDGAISARLPHVLAESWDASVADFLGKRLPVVTIRQNDHAYVRDLSLVTGEWLMTPASTWFPDWTAAIVTGDSGKPILLMVDNELVLLAGWTLPSRGHPLHSHISDINAAMETLSTANSAPVYTVTEYDLGEFNDYSSEE